MEVLHSDLAGTASPAGMRAPCIGLAPRPAFELDLILKFVILGFALNSVDLQEVVDLCHSSLLAVRSFAVRSTDSTSSISLADAGREAGNKAQADVHALELVVRTQVEARAVVTGILLVLEDLNLRVGERPARLGLLRGDGRIAVDIFEDPILQPAL